MNPRPLFVLLLGFVVGCGSGTPSADTARPVEDTGPKALDLPPVAGPKPAASEPAAALLVNAVLMAHTSSEPSRVDKLKKVRVKRTGVFSLAEQQSNATMDIYLWGDQYRANYALAVQGNAVNTFSLNGNAGWKIVPALGTTTPSPMTPEDLDSVLPDVTADRLLFLVPLADPKLVAVTARPAKDGGDAVVRVWVGDAGPVLLSVDATTNRLKRITYEAKETGQTAVRSLELLDLDPVAGVLLPKRIRYAVGTVSLTNWTKVEYEVPGVFELGVFDKP